MSIAKAAKPSSFGCLEHLRPSVATGDFPVIAALAPAFRALLLLTPNSIDLLAHYQKLADEHETYIGPVALADFARRHGWKCEFGVRCCLRFLKYCDRRGPRGFCGARPCDKVGLGLLSDTAGFLSAQSFASIIFSDICADSNASPHEDHLFSDLLRTYDRDEYWKSVVSELNALIGREIGLNY